MSKKFRFAASALFLFIFIACKKDNGSGGGGATPTALAGNWTFSSLTAKTQSTVTATSGGLTDKDLTVSQYTTTNNSGLITFSADSMYGKGIGYSINTVAKGYEYENGVLLDSVDAPFSFTYPSSNSASKYQLIGKDSIYFPGGGLVNPPGSSGSIPTVASGGHIVFNGNTISITVSINQNTTQSAGGITAVSQDQGVETVTLTRQ
jgi:hypothetical protein